MRINNYILMFSVMWVSVSEARFDSNNETIVSVSNWKVEAIKHLDVDIKTLSKCKANRCVRLNNYWCLKDIGWDGVVGKDTDGHAGFKNGYYAARATVRNFRTAYIKHGRKSALSIMQAYAPVSDCIGSDEARRADGTCIHGNNDSKQYAKAVSIGITDDINADLMLFDAGGKATTKLIVFLENISSFEIGGLKVSKETIQRGICMEASICEAP